MSPMKRCILETRAEQLRRPPQMEIHHPWPDSGCEFYFLNQERKYLCRHDSQLGNSFYVPFNPFCSSGASFGCLFPVCHPLPPHPTPTPLLFLVPTLFPSTTQSLWEGEGEVLVRALSGVDF